MKKLISCSSFLFLVPLLLAACGGGTQVINTNDADAVADMKNTMSLEYRDWTNTADAMVNSMVASGALPASPKPVIAVANVTNDTMQRFDTDILTKKIRTQLLSSGRAQIATSFQNQTVTATGYVPTTASLVAASTKGTTLNAKMTGVAAVEYQQPVSEDDTTHQVRAQRGNPEYDPNTIAKQGTLVAPNMSLSGKMIQRNIQVDSCWLCSSQTRVEYYLQMTLTDVKTGLSVWEDEQPILKQGRTSTAPTF